jgi:hypothetical protein
VNDQLLSDISALGGVTSLGGVVLAQGNDVLAQCQVEALALAARLLTTCTCSDNDAVAACP